METPDIALLCHYMYWWLPFANLNTINVVINFNTVGRTLWLFNVISIRSNPWQTNGWFPGNTPLTHYWPKLQMWLTEIKGLKHLLNQCMHLMPDGCWSAYKDTLFPMYPYCTGLSREVIPESCTFSVLKCKWQCLLSAENGLKFLCTLPHGRLTAPSLCAHLAVPPFWWPCSWTVLAY